MRDFLSITKNTLPKKEFFFNFKKLSVHEELSSIIVIHLGAPASSAGAPLILSLFRGGGTLLRFGVKVAVKD